MTAATAIAAAIATAVAVHSPKRIKKLAPAKQVWLETTLPIIKEVCTENEIPYQVCMAQAALESGWGQHARGNNLFGMKGSGTDGKHDDGYAKYLSQKDSINSYCKAIRTNQFWSWIVPKYANDPQKYAIALWGSSYAPSVNYVPTVFSVMGTIYRATGNADFDIDLSKSDRSMISRIGSLEMGEGRRKRTRSLL